MHGCMGALLNKAAREEGVICVWNVFVGFSISWVVNWSSVLLLYLFIVSVFFFMSSLFPRKQSDLLLLKIYTNNITVVFAIPVSIQLSSLSSFSPFYGQ